VNFGEKMKTNNYKPLSINSEKGVALIIALGILAILAILGTSFAINMRLEQKASANYRDMVKATYIAEMGIAKAMRQLRNELTGTHLKGNFDSFNDDWAGSEWDEADIPLNTNSVTGATNEIGKFTLKILDVAARIYINDENTNLEDILNALGEAVDGTNKDDEYGKGNDRPILFGDGKNDGKEIVDYLDDLLDAKRGFRTEEEIRLAPDTLISTNRDAYVAIEDFITANTVVNPDAGVKRAPVNINTASPEVLMTLIGGIDGLTPTNEVTIATVAAIMQYRENKIRVYHDDGNDAQSWEWDEDLGYDGYIVDPEDDEIQGKPNPFDGWDSNRGDTLNLSPGNRDLDPVVGFIGPLGQEYNYNNSDHYLFENDWLDVNNSGGFPDEGEMIDNNGDGAANTGSNGPGLDGDDDGDKYIDEEDEYADSHIFVGGARGEFEALINQLAAGGYGYDEDGNPLKISSHAQEIIKNADPLFGADTTEFSFRSRNFIIFSTGTLYRRLYHNGEFVDKPVAKRSIMRIIQR